MNTEYTFRPVTKNDVQQFFAWQYPAPYNIYNLGKTPSHEDMAYYLDRQYHYHVMYDDTGKIIAFCSFGLDGQVCGGDYSEDAVDIGMGVRPDLTGQGNGLGYVQAVITFAYAQFNPTSLRVTIAGFNQRAQSVWQKAGFKEISRFNSARDNRPFLIFVKQNQT